MPNPQPKPEPHTPANPGDAPEPTPSDPPHPHEPEPDQQTKVQKQLDEALEDSFPASDPVSIVTSQEEEDWGAGDTAPAPPSPTER